jgi:predicted aspartyl protease
MTLPAAATVKFSIIAGSIYFSAQIDGRPVHAILDTGAQVSVVTPDAAPRSSGGQARVSTDIGHSTASLSGPATVSIAGQQFQLARLIVAHLPFLEQTGAPVDIIVGQDVLDKSLIRLDFDHKELSFPPRQSALDSEYAKVPLTRDVLGRPMIKFQFCDESQIDAVLDTGSNSTILLSPAVDISDCVAPRAKHSTALISTMSGAVTANVMSVTSVKIRNTILKDIPITQLPVWNNHGLATIGLPTLQNLGIIFDFHNNVIWFKKDAHEIFERDMTGLGFAYLGDHLEIVHVAVGGPAEGLGVKVGDIISRIDGQAIDKEYFTSNLWTWRFSQNRDLEITVNGRNILIHTRRYY